MKQAIVVDAVTHNRSTLLHQLTQAGFATIFQYKNLTEAHNKLLTLTLFTGVVVISLESDNPVLSEFLRYARAKHPDLSVIAVVESLSLSQMRELVSLGIDHVLLRPFNVFQLTAKVEAAQSFREQVVNENMRNPGSTYFESFVEKITDRYFKVSLLGWLSENCELPLIEGTDAGTTVFIDCDKLKGINSIGVRSWILWLKSLSNQGVNRFEFENLHAAILQQASTVNGFLPAGSAVNSFFLFYWSDELSEEKEFRLVFGKNYGTTQMRVPLRHTEARNNGNFTFELDENAKKLLKFYKGQIEFSSSKEG